MDSLNSKVSRQQDLLSDFLSQWSLGEGVRVNTSGSTGTPKEILLPHEVLVRSARRTANFFGLHKNSHIHSAISFEYIGGKMMIARSLVAGCRLSFCNPSLSPELPPDNSAVDLMSVVPAQMVHILDNLDSFRRVRKFLIGGSSIDPRLWDRIVESGVQAWESYGMTETASHVALRRICGSASRRPRFIPLPGISVSTDFDGRIHIRDEKSFFTTNDCGRSFPDGSFIVSGRMDHMIISGGIKVNPLQVEEVLVEYMSDLLDHFFISSSPDERWTSRIVLVGESPDTSDNAKRDLASRIKGAIDNIPLEVLPLRLRPKEIILLDRFDYTPSGKLIRRIP